MSTIGERQQMATNLMSLTHDPSPWFYDEFHGCNELARMVALVSVLNLMA